MLTMEMPNEQSQHQQAEEHNSSEIATLLATVYQTAIQRSMDGEDTPMEDLT